MKSQKIRDLRTYILKSDDQGADYHARGGDHWINKTRIATPMSKYPEFSETRSSFGIDVLGTLLVEVESESGKVGFSVTTGGLPAAFLVEKHFKRFVIGQEVTALEKMFDMMYRASIFYGRKGLTINAISGIDCAIWDLLGRIRQEPVWSMIGGKVRDLQPMYATGPRPDLAKEMGFNAVGTTLGSRNVDYGVENLKLNVKEIGECLNEVLPFPSEYFDVVAGFQVFEHALAPLLFC